MIKLGFAMCGSFCTFDKAIEKLKNLKKDYEIFPIMSENAFNIDTRFGKAEDFQSKIKNICKKDIINSISSAEPLGPKKLVDILVVAPCTGNTASKVAGGITDTSVTMAVKSCLRIGIPVVLCICTNDALGASFQNIGRLMNVKNIFLTPMYQDDFKNKPSSLVGKFDKLEETISQAIEKKQIQPLF